MNFKKSIIVICLVSLLCYDGRAQNTNDRKYLTSLSSAFGYIEGQLSALRLIGKNVSKFTTKAFTLWQSFTTQFGPIRDSIEVYLKRVMGEKLMDSLKENISAGFLSLENRFKYDETSAQVKIIEVENALNWQIPSPFLQSLLSVKYYHNPHQEFLDSHTQVFSTKGHPKSKGSNWQIKVPVSWISNEGERPNIIQKFSPQSESGLVSISIIVKNLELPAGVKLSKKEIDAFFTEKEAKGMVPDGGKFVSFKKMVFDGITGGLLISDQEMERLDLKIQVRSHSFIFYWKEQLYYLNCSVGSIVDKTSVSQMSEKYMPLFRLVANSIVLTSKYE